MAKCSLLKIKKFFASKLHFRNRYVSCLNSQAYGIAFSLSFAFLPLAKIHQIWCLSLHPLLEHPSYRQFFLVLTEVHWFSHPYGLDLICDNLRENQVERVSPKSYSSFITPEDKGKHKVCTFARLGLAAGEASVVMPTRPFTSRSTLLSIYTCSCSPLQIPDFSHLPPPEI